MRKTKIVCTIGPNFCGYEELKALITAGMDAVRLNFSHGDYSYFETVISLVRQLEQDMQKNIVIIQDLCGPKIRVGRLPEGGVELRQNELVELYPETSEPEGNPARITISYHDLAGAVNPGYRILLDDGSLELEVTALNPPVVQCKVITGGVLTSHKGVNLPGADLKISALTDKDKADLEFGLEQGVDWVALSFVRQATDVRELKALMKKAGKTVPVIAKIEKEEGFRNLDEILGDADGIMVARGDMGVELPVEEVPVIQKQIIKCCNREAKPVITATQMLDSMIEHPRPTRAEVADIANAILDGSDAVMLSGETASGKYPVRAVQVMAKVAEYTEKTLKFKQIRDRETANNVLETLSLATCQIAENLEASAVAVSTSSGRSARVIAKFRTTAPVIAFTEVPATLKSLALGWGIFPVLAQETKDTDGFLYEVENTLIDRGYAKPGDLVVMSAGVPVGISGSTNMVKVQVLGHKFLRGRGVGSKVKLQGRLKNYAEAWDSGDILVLPKLDESIAAEAAKAKGLIIINGDKDSEIEQLCLKYRLNAVIGAPGAAQLASGNFIELDIARGLILF